jgi:hypothetical protein
VDQQHSFDFDFATKYRFICGLEEDPLLAAKDCTVCDWRNISCSKRNDGELTNQEISNIL